MSDMENEVYMKMYRKLVNELISQMIESLAVTDEVNDDSTESSKDNSNKPLMILGPSAVGKDTMINRLKAKFPKVIYKLPSYTTRPKRKGEIEGVDYYYVTKEEFLKLKNEGKLFGIQEYNNNYYASNKSKLKEALEDKAKVIILNYNIETANAVKDELDFNYVALLPPSESALRERLIKRGTKAEEVEKRMEKSIKEIQLINEANYIDFRLVNNDKDEAFKRLENHLKEIYPQLL